MYYTSRVKPEIPLDSMDTNISMLRQQTERKFKMEPKEIQDEVMCIHKKQITSKNSIAVAKVDEVHLNIDVEVHQSNIQQCAPALQQILDHLSRKTGWSFSILMGGPDPIEPEGQCVVVSLHTGNNSHGKKFGESYSAFDSTIVQVYAEFLDLKYHTHTNTKTELPTLQGDDSAPLSDGDKMHEGKDQGVGDNSDGESDDENDGDESDDDGRNEEGDVAVAEDEAGDMDQLSDELLYPLISVLIRLDFCALGPELDITEPPAFTTSCSFGRPQSSTSWNAVPAIPVSAC
ncbi:hypothetical protein SCLCIDRAFT_10445 [Scleroderma citrinum Foug A]|uniref:Uncharacterized protein n=1 Tax=Scleroderma citrinum Foug A TaxID=1036808 RepID=A0A0C3DML4_9AGAM|nr:hypothetical protein SCLCIDRAFT_10445 [Scleroderma citrinum Foug A]